MKKESFLSVSKVIAAIGRPIYFYPVISHCLNNLDAAIFVGNFMYWQGKESEKNNGWIYKSMEEIESETGLKRRRQENVRKFLKEIGILQTKLTGVPARIHYWFDWNKLDEMLNNYIAQNDIDTQEAYKNIAGDDEKEKKKKKPKQPKEPKPPKEEKTPTVLYQMKVIFDEVYDETTEAGKEDVGYEWTDKDWKHLKHLKTAFYNRGMTKKKRIAEKSGENKDPIIVTDEEILVSWKAFLQSLPKSVRKKFFTPAALYGNFNSILNQIIDERSKHNGDPSTQTRTGARSTASDYV